MIDILCIFLHIHISHALIFFSIFFVIVHVSQPYRTVGKISVLTILFLVSILTCLSRHNFSNPIIVAFPIAIHCFISLSQKDGEEIEVVKSFTFLGSEVEKEEMCDKEIKRRMAIETDTSVIKTIHGLKSHAEPTNNTSSLKNFGGVVFIALILILR